MGRFTPLAIAVSTVVALAQAAPVTAAELAILTGALASTVEWWRRG